MIYVYVFTVYIYDSFICLEMRELWNYLFLEILFILTVLIWQDYGKIENRNLEKIIHLKAKELYLSEYINLKGCLKNDHKSVSRDHQVVYSVKS